MIGQVLGHYRILEKIGSGGMGEVYRAHDDRLQRDVAVKILKPSSASDPDRLRRFEQEAKASAALNHPNIVAIYDIGLHDGAPYIVSELLQGETLRDRLRTGPLPVRQVADYSRQIAEGLVGAHERRIVHRDLKPENLFLTRDGHVKILDFGIAKLTSQEESDDLSMISMTTQTKAGTMLGTVGYMSPEQLRGKAVDHRSDIFSFGSILYEMLTGKRAFVGETEVDTMMAVLNTDPSEVALTRQNVPAAFDQIIQHCLEKEPENRFQSARDLAFALGTVTSTGSRQVVPVNPKRFHKRIIWTLAALALVGLAVLITIFVMPTPAPEYRRITFERGTVYSARFSPDGRNVLYGAAWNGRPQELYTTVGDSSLARPLGFTSAYLLGISHNNELAVALRWLHGARRDIVGGVLARAPIAGGTPKEVLEDVRWADWSPDNQLAVVHHKPGHSRLEFPIGKLLYETSGWITNIRFSPQGDRIAFMDHPAAWDDRGSVCVIDLNGKKTVLSPNWFSLDGLSWSSRGDEVWFTGAESSFSNRILWAVNLSGRLRKVLSMPGGFTLQDIANDGRVLITMDTERLAMERVGQDQKQVQDLSWYDWSIAKDISRDGQWVLFEEGSEPAGPNYAVAIRKIDGSPPIRLGEGSVGGLSPDGKWVLAIFTGTPQHISLLPIGPGEARQITVAELKTLENGTAGFMPDGQSIVVNGTEAGHTVRTYLIDIAGTKPPRAITPEGVVGGLPSPDGKYLLGAGPAEASRKLMLYPIDGSAPIPLSISVPPYGTIKWTADSKALYLFHEDVVPTMVYRYELTTQKIMPLRELTPADRAGVVSIGPVVTNFSASEFAYSYYQTLSVMYVVSGLR